MCCLVQPSAFSNNLSSIKCARTNFFGGVPIAFEAVTKSASAVNE